MVTRLTVQDVTVRFVGGPRDGLTKTYPRDPISIGCASEVRERSIPKGLYRTTGFNAAGELLAHWRVLEVKPKAEPND